MRTPVVDHDASPIMGRPVHSPAGLVERLHELAESDEITEALRAVLDDADELSPSALLDVAHALSMATERVGNRWRDLAHALRAHARARTPE